jgi:hypothetical protein
MTASRWNCNVYGTTTTRTSFASTCSTVTICPSAPRRIEYSRLPGFLISGPPLHSARMRFSLTMATTSPTPDRAWIVNCCPSRSYVPCQTFFPFCAIISHPYPARKAAIRKTSAPDSDLCAVDGHFSAALSIGQREQMEGQAETYFSLGHPILWQNAFWTHGEKTRSLCHSMNSSEGRSIAA